MLVYSNLFSGPTNGCCCIPCHIATVDYLLSQNEQQDDSQQQKQQQKQVKSKSKANKPSSSA